MGRWFTINILTSIISGNTAFPITPGLIMLCFMLSSFGARQRFIFLGDVGNVHPHFSDTHTIGPLRTIKMYCIIFGNWFKENRCHFFLDARAFLLCWNLLPLSLENKYLALQKLVDNLGENVGAELLIPGLRCPRVQQRGHSPSSNLRPRHRMKMGKR